MADGEKQSAGTVCWVLRRSHLLLQVQPANVRKRAERLGWEELVEDMQLARASLPPCLDESADRTPATAWPPLRSPAAQLQDTLLLAGCPELCLSSGMGPPQGKFNWVLWQPKSTRTLQGVVEKSEFDMLGNI